MEVSEKDKTENLRYHCEILFLLINKNSNAFPCNKKQAKTCRLCLYVANQNSTVFPFPQKASKNIEPMYFLGCYMETCKLQWQIFNHIDADTDARNLPISYVCAEWKHPHAHIQQHVSAQGSASYVKLWGFNGH